MAFMVYGMLMDAHLHTPTHTRAQTTCTQACTYTRSHAHAFVHTFTEAYTYSCIASKWIHVRTRPCTFVHAHTCAWANNQETQTYRRIHVYAYHCTRLHAIHAYTCLCEYNCHRSHTYAHAIHVCTRCFCQWHPVTSHRVHVHS